MACAEVDEVARDVLSAPTTGRYSSPPSDRSAVSADDDHIQAIYTQSVLADAPQQPQTQVRLLRLQVTGKECQIVNVRVCSQYLRRGDADVIIDS